MKDIHSQGEGGFVQCRQDGRRVLKMQTFALFGSKNVGSFKIYGVSAWTGE